MTLEDLPLTQKTDIHPRRINLKIDIHERDLPTQFELG